jgi:hypothetical protein
MTRDPKQTQTLEEPREPSETPKELDIALRTTLVQPIPLSRHKEFVRTRYWEKLTADTEEAPKRTLTSYGSASKTSVGLGPDDPIVKAVQAAKQQLLEAERVQQERASDERMRVAEVASASSASTAKTALLPAFEVLQIASRIKPKAEKEALDAIELPKHRLKPIFIGVGGLGMILFAATLGYLMPASPAEEHAEQSIVKPRAQAAAETPRASSEQRSASVLPTSEPVASSGSAPSQAPQLPLSSEKAAVDALFAGDYDLASRHYVALAHAHPEQPAYAEAARILKRNLRPGTK